MLTPLRPFHPSGTVTGWALRIRIRENSTAVFRLRTFGPGLRPNTGGCPWHASGRRNTALAHALIARRENHPASFPLPNSHGRKRPQNPCAAISPPAHSPNARAAISPPHAPCGAGQGGCARLSRIRDSPRSVRHPSLESEIQSCRHGGLGKCESVAPEPLKNGFRPEKRSKK
jgi:hypothetical protein